MAKQTICDRCRIVIDKNGMQNGKHEYESRTGNGFILSVNLLERDKDGDHAKSADLCFGCLFEFFGLTPVDKQPVNHNIPLALPIGTSMEAISKAVESKATLNLGALRLQVARAVKEFGESGELWDSKIDRVFRLLLWSSTFEVSLADGRFPKTPYVVITSANAAVSCNEVRTRLDQFITAVERAIELEESKNG